MTVTSTLNSPQAVEIGSFVTKRLVHGNHGRNEEHNVFLCLHWISIFFLFEASLTYQWANLMRAISMDTT